MYVIHTEHDKTNNRALVVPTKEWKRLKNIIAKKDEGTIAGDAVKKLRNERKAASKAITDTWTNTAVNQRRLEIEKRRKYLADIENEKVKRDEEIRIKVLARRNEIAEKVRAKKWSEKDSTKAITRAVHNIEIIRERDIQKKFNEAEEAKIMEAKRLQMIEENLEAERYRKEQCEEKLKLAETKKANADLLLKELKERENKRQNLDIQLHEEGQAQLQKIAKEIEEEIKEKKAKIIANKERMVKNLNESRENVDRKKKLQQLEEQEENMVISIMEEARKKMAKIRKLKEIQLLKESQQLSEKLGKKANTNVLEKINDSERRYQNAIKEKEYQYIKKENQVKELAEKRKKELNDFKKFFDEETRKEKERLTLSAEWESKRLKKDAEFLNNLKESNCQKKLDEMNRYREHLDVQCDNNKMADMADKREQMKQHDEYKKLWCQENEDFMTYINKLIDEYKKAGISVVPLLKSIQEYGKNNNLYYNECGEQENNVCDSKRI